MEAYGTMSNLERLRSQLPHNFIDIMFTSWATMREYGAEKELGCLTFVRHAMEDLRETIAVEPDLGLLTSLTQMLGEPVLRMLTIVTAVKDPTSTYKTLAETHGVRYIGHGGKIMATNLTLPSNEPTPEERLAAVDPAISINFEEKPDGCISVKVMAGEKAVSYGQAAVKEGIATFDGVYTEEDFQRRGLATTIMAYLVRWALSRSASIGLLSASPFGEMLYEGLGWTTLYEVVHLGTQMTIDFQERMRQKYAPQN